MKNLICAVLLLSACGESSKKETNAIAPLENVSEKITATADVSVAQAAAVTPNQCYIPDYKAFPDAPAGRTDLYQCQGIGGDPKNTFKGYVEVYSDLTRKYHLTLTLKDGTIKESFIAGENAKDAAPYSPIKLEAGAIQSSNVLRGINADTKAALGYGEDSNFRIKLSSSNMKPNIEMKIDVVGTGYTGIPLGIGYGVCVRIGN